MHRCSVFYEISGLVHMYGHLTDFFVAYKVPMFTDWSCKTNLQILSLKCYKNANFVDFSKPITIYDSIMCHGCLRRKSDMA